MTDTIFGKIAAGEAQADIVYEDERAVAFRDIAPQAPVHVLVIPRQGLRNVADAEEADRELLGHLMWVAAEVARQLGLEASGYRIVTNIGQDGGQTVDHLHLHLLGGRGLSWPPG